MFNRMQPFYLDFDAEATAVVTPPKQAATDDTQSISTLCNPSTSFTDHINQLQQKFVSVTLFSPMSKWVNKERQQCVSVRINLPSGIIINKAIKVTASDDFTS